MKAPGLKRPWSALCAVLTVARDLEHAKFACQYALKLDSNDVHSHLHYGICLYLAHDYATAELEMLKSVELDPKFAAGYFNLGQLKFDLNDQRPANIIFKERLISAPEMPSYITIWE
jgi:tetratricopeptide (TPR) repeat protein